MKVFGSIILFSLIFGSMAKGQGLKEVIYQENNQKLAGLISSNAGKSLPAVLILPAWKGIDKEAKNAALDLEKEGYLVLIADIYGVGNTPKDNAEAGKQSSIFKKDFATYQKRIQAGLDELKKQGATKIAVIGYCFGGTGALEAARGGLNVEGAVSIHGGLAKDPSREIQPVKTKVLVLHPADDASVSKADYDGFVKEMDDAKADWQIITYANSKHTFTNPESPDYNAIMAKRAWKHTKMFLDEVLK